MLVPVRLDVTSGEENCGGADASMVLKAMLSLVLSLELDLELELDLDEDGASICFRKAKICS